jgi:transcriptional regulator with XRE-family HTH domain
MNIGAKIKELRNFNKLTQVKLAKKANISRSYLADIENNRYNASVDTLNSIANALDVSMNTFFADGVLEPESTDYFFEQYLNKLGFEIIYDDTEGYLILNTSDAQYEVSPIDLDNLQDNVESFIKFKISEVTSKCRKFYKNTNNDLPIAAHNDFEDDKEQQELMKEDLDEL